MAAVGLVAAGCAPVEPAPTKSPSATPIGPPDWAALGTALTGKLLRPGDGGYDIARLVENPRYDSARPLAILTAASAADVAAGLAFATKYAVPLALRSGGHSYTGWSSGGATGSGMPASLVIDTRGMTAITLNPDHTIRIGAGASLAEVYSTVGTAGRAIGAGSCATVGATGLTLGGGVGVLVRAFGLSSDQLTEVEIVTADGTIRTANASTDADLFWACRGGGGGHLGVVTAITLSTRPAPQVTTFSLRWPFAAAAAVIKAWQAWAPTADPQLWSTLKLLGGETHPSGPGVYLAGTWLGEKSSLTSQLAPFLSAVGAAPSHNGSATLSYLAAMMSYAGCAAIPLAQCHTGAGGTLLRVSSAATSHVPYQALDEAGIATVIAKVTAVSAVPGITEGGISMDALGGAVGTLAPDATAFPHRKALMTVQYTATFSDGADPAPYDAYVRGFRAALVPKWGNGAYVNYADASLQDPATAYFGDNAARLASIRKKYDPRGMFTQPQGY
ncbi:MAG: FAD-binding protein [Microbacteriaceae bacterium]|nr:FAD-binding protein [Microbacteriaceae bacterium]